KGKLSFSLLSSSKDSIRTSNLQRRSCGNRASLISLMFSSLSVNPTGWGETLSIGNKGCCNKLVGASKTSSFLLSSSKLDLNTFSLGQHSTYNLTNNGHSRSCFPG
ncbi:hypothetical protein V8G54_021581, partial [Vigna mungo]